MADQFVPPGVRRSRSDALSEQMEGAGRGQRGVLTFFRGVSSAVRVYFMIGAVGAGSGFVVALVNGNAGGALGAVAMVVFFGALLAVNGGPETVREVKGPDGQYVIRIGPCARWRLVHGTDRIGDFFSGLVVWRAVLRERRHDPIGPAAAVVLTTTEREALTCADEMEQQVKAGHSEVA